MGPPPSSQIPENAVTGPAGNIVPDAYQPHSLAGLPLVGTSGSALGGGIGVEAAQFEERIGRSFEPAAEDVPDPTLEREHVRSALAVRYLPVCSGLIRHDFDYTVFLENSIVHKGFLLLFVFIF